jgi:hypothetical protein
MLALKDDDILNGMDIFTKSSYDPFISNSKKPLSIDVGARGASQSNVLAALEALETPTSEIKENKFSHTPLNRKLARKSNFMLVASDVIATPNHDRSGVDLTISYTGVHRLLV